MSARLAGQSVNVAICAENVDYRFLALHVLILLGIRIRSEGLAQVMTKRNASE